MIVPKARQTKILENLGFTIREDAAGLQVSPPPWRGDIDGAADLGSDPALVDQDTEPSLDSDDKVPRDDAMGAAVDWESNETAHDPD